MEDMVAKFDSSQRVFLFNVNEQQREFQDEQGNTLIRQRGCTPSPIQTTTCHNNPHYYLSRIACPAGDKPRGDYAVIQDTRDLAGQARF